MDLSFKNQVSRIRPLYDYLQKQKDNHRFVRSIEISATFILISFFLFFAIRPTALTISALWGDIKSKQLLKSQLKAKINNVIQAQDQFSQVQQRYQIVNDSLPDQPRFSAAASQIQQSGNSSNINIDTFSYNLQNNSKSLEISNTKNYQILINANAPYSSVSKLVSDLLNNRRLINITAINIGVSSQTTSGSEDIQSPRSLTTSFTSSYYYWDPAE